MKQAQVRLRALHAPFDSATSRRGLLRWLGHRWRGTRALSLHTMSLFFSLGATEKRACLMKGSKAAL